MRQDDLSAALRAAATTESPVPARELGLSVVIAMRDGEAVVAPLLDRLTQVLDRLPVTSEVVVVDDGSRDRTAERLEAAARDSRIRLVLLRGRHGEALAVTAGIDHARGSVVVTMDGDLRSDPEDIPRLLARLEEGYDVVTGFRHRPRTGRLGALLSRGADRLISMAAGVDLRDHGCTLKAFRMESAGLVRGSHRLVAVEVARHGGRAAEIEVTHRPGRPPSWRDDMVVAATMLLDVVASRLLSQGHAGSVHVLGLIGLAAVTVSLASGLLALCLAFVVGAGALLMVLLAVTVAAFLGGLGCLLAGLLAALVLRVRDEVWGGAIYSIRDLKNFDDA